MLTTKVMLPVLQVEGVQPLRTQVPALRVESICEWASPPLKVHKRLPGVFSQVTLTGHSLMILCYWDSEVCLTLKSSNQECKPTVFKTLWKTYWGFLIIIVIICVINFNETWYLKLVSSIKVPIQSQFWHFGAHNISSQIIFRWLSHTIHVCIRLIFLAVKTGQRLVIERATWGWASKVARCIGVFILVLRVIL